MRTKKNLAAILALTLMVGIAGVMAGEDSEAYEQTTISIDGMTCGGCVGAVKIQLKRTEGVKEYEVSLEDGEAVVMFDPERTDPVAIAKSISKTGFEAKVKEE